MESNIADKTEILAKTEGEKIKEQLNRETARKNLDGQRKAQVQCWQSFNDKENSWQLEKQNDDLWISQCQRSRILVSLKNDYLL